MTQDSRLMLRQFATSQVTTRRGRGFTLIEVLVVVGIIVLLAGLVLAGVLVAKKKATETRIRSDLALIGTALEAYKGDFGDYPRFDDDNSTDSLNVQMDRGARILCRALLSPASASLPSGITKIGFVAGNSEAAPDGADGPGFRVRGTQGKVYGPYLDSSKFRLGNPAAPINSSTGLPGWDNTNFTDATLLDINGNSILYYPAATTGSPNNLYVKSVAPLGVGVATVRPLYNAYDNIEYSESTPSASSGYILSEQQMQFILGDRNFSGTTGDTDASSPSGTDQPATTLPYLLWTAGADGQFGFGIDPNTKAPLIPTPNAGLKTDDITNFDIPSDLRK